MKLEPQFKSEKNILYFLDGTPVSLSDIPCLEAASCSSAESAAKVSAPVVCVRLPWTLVGLDEDCYNEEFLAGFRDFLKALEEKKSYAFIVPLVDVPADDDGKKEALTAGMKHCARRIKDCASVIGFAVPDEADCAYFKEALSAKHAQYVFFSRNETILSDGTIVKF